MNNLPVSKKKKFNQQLLRTINRKNCEADFFLTKWIGTDVKRKEIQQEIICIIRRRDAEWIVTGG